MEETHTRDGCYVSFDGWQHQLRAPRVRGDHVVFLDPYVLARLMTIGAPLDKRETRLRGDHAQTRGEKRDTDSTSTHRALGSTRSSLAR